ncbi:hypothetical protein L1987_32869 [Smallanthus sonchifolius]|uniref:Uncharacterized protein n=1 Tax=Smallanthus sonchifolius TaxID=185202 RepID=A0ACB9HP88_9ASTR|nr:hypothetical protein L1987_32869 [Smallanthus sonchifolius]
MSPHSFFPGPDNPYSVFHDYFPAGCNSDYPASDSDHNPDLLHNPQQPTLLPHIRIPDFVILGLAVMFGEVVVVEVHL